MLLTKNMSIIAIRSRQTTILILSSPPTGETVDARGDGALVGQVSGDAALVLGGSASDEGGVEDEPVLGSVSSGLKGSEKTQLVFTFTTHRLTVTIYLW